MRTTTFQLDPVDFAAPDDVRRCRVCGCTDLDCRGCIERTGEPCSWVEEEGEHPDGPICSACVPGLVT